MKLNNEAGFSLIELVIGIIIIAVSLVGALYVLAELQSKGSKVELITRSTSMASTIKEVIQSQNFDENDSPPWSSLLGPEEGSVTEYDDVDDYAGYNWTLPGYNGYQGHSRVYYINPQNNWIDSTGIVTGYKLILVTVNFIGSDHLTRLSSIKTPREIDTGGTGGLGGPPPPPTGF